MDRVLQFITRRAVWVLCALVLLTLLAVSQIVDLRSGEPRLVLDGSADRMLPEDETLSIALAELYNRIGRYEDAAELAIRVATALPEWAEPHHILGTAYLAQGQTQLAIEEFEKFVQKAPDVAEGHHQLGNAYLYRGQKAEALAAFEAALERDPEWVDALTKSATKPLPR